MIIAFHILAMLAISELVVMGALGVLQIVQNISTIVPMFYS